MVNVSTVKSKPFAPAESILCPATSVEESIERVFGVGVAAALIAAVKNRPPKE
jgi:hypothetical protein